MDTGKIADNAVSQDATATQTTSSSQSVTGGGVSSFTGFSTSYTSDGGRLLIMFKGNASATFDRGGGGTFNLTAQLEVDGTAYDSVSTLIGVPSTGIGAETVELPFQTFIIVQPAAGAHTISLVVSCDSGMPATADSAIGADSCRFSIIELLK